ncbi:sugar phosphate isomerase/epimerase family protein [Stratiformator vulcanicus]|uniref:Xylose isomerase-like TIM barrel domain-containing protein n=1 Tax=Stratiformator vulcanicus TaxID=2527980 RepID=A0A517QYA2_9PLAN|nr:TIM barrel protein [Stratiformator vulcanicus]QDT36573.1 hypothetical protein Pan189_09330 [Stratiformator vulcanicus]
MFVAVSLQSFWDLSLEKALELAEETGFDKVELWFDDQQGMIRSADVAAAPESFVNKIRDLTRLTPIAFQLDKNVTPEVMTGIAKAAKLLRVAQVTVPSSPLGTPFNEEVDRLRALVGAASPDGVRVSVKTKTGDLTEDPDTTRSLCDSVKGLGVTLDPSYFLCGPHRGVDYDVLFERVYLMHLRDTSTESVQVPVGLGEIDYSRLINKVGHYRNDAILSVNLIPEFTDPETRGLELRKLRMLLDTLL